MNTIYHPTSPVIARIYDHAKLGLTSKLSDRANTTPNMVEQAGDAILWTTETLARSVKALIKSFQDPRVVTVAITATALFATSLAFYPATTVALTKTSYAFAAKLITQVPYWTVKFSAYILICSNIVGYGLRAGGRFNNSELMKAFYGLPADFPHNPAYLTAHEIAEHRHQRHWA